MNFEFAVRFLGIGNSQALELGTSSWAPVQFNVFQI